VLAAPWIALVALALASGCSSSRPVIAADARVAPPVAAVADARPPPLLVDAATPTPAHLRNEFTEPGLSAFAATSARQAAAFPGVVVLEELRAPPAVALTFDDGPDDVGCPAVLDVLAARRVPATFFVLGEMVARHPAVARRMVGAGHQVAMHGWTHTSLRGLTPARAIATHVERTRAALRAAVGDRFSADLLRPPYGDVSDAQLVALGRAGLRVPLWSIDALDWVPAATPTEISTRVAGLLHPGAIVLLHCGRGHGVATAAALPAILDALAARGLAARTLAELLGPSEPSP